MRARVRATAPSTFPAAVLAELRHHAEACLSRVPKREREPLGPELRLEASPVPSWKREALLGAWGRTPRRGDTDGAPLILFRREVERLSPAARRFLVFHETAHAVLNAQGRHGHSEADAEAKAEEWGEPVRPGILAELDRAWSYVPSAERSDPLDSPEALARAKADAERRRVEAECFRLRNP